MIGSVEQYQDLYDRAKNDPNKFWGEIANEEMHWFEPYQSVLEGSGKDITWFAGGKTNLSYNCLDANIAAGKGDKKAIIWEGEPGDTRTLTYSELHAEVCKFANALKGLGVTTGDVVSIYMPMTPELAIAMLACVRIGAVHSVIFAGFSAEAIADRNNDASAKVQLTSDGLYRRGKVLPLKETVDKALEKSPTVEHCIVLKRCENEIQMAEGRDHWWHELTTAASDDCPATPLDSEATSFILYTAVQPENQKAFDTPPPATTFGPRKPSNGCSITVKTMSTGVLPTAVGSPVTVTSSTAQWPMVRLA